MEYDPLYLYRLMYKSRYFETLVTDLWKKGLISGEMHPGIGEEAIVAAVVSHLEEEDAMALDHRCTPPLLMRGVDPEALLKEMLGMEDGLCKGQGGHMHFSSRGHKVLSSGIVGASGPAAVGFAFAARYEDKGSIAVSFSGEGSFNQGGMMESMNLASAWGLPVVFVCKDDGMSITTDSENMTGGDLKLRARGLGLKVVVPAGNRVEDIWKAAGEAVKTTRRGEGPVFLHAECIHPEGHFLGYQMKRIFKNPLMEIPAVSFPLISSIVKKGAPFIKKLSGLSLILKAMKSELESPGRKEVNDPIFQMKRELFSRTNVDDLESDIRNEIDLLFDRVLKGGRK